MQFVLLAALRGHHVRRSERLQPGSPGYKLAQLHFMLIRALLPRTGQEHGHERLSISLFVPPVCNALN